MGCEKNPEKPLEEKEGEAEAERGIDPLTDLKVEELRQGH